MKIANAYVSDARTIFAADEATPLVLIETEHGEIYVHVKADMRTGQAERLCNRVTEAGAVDVTHWSFWRSIYGSEAQQVEEADAFIMAQAIRMGFATEADFEGTAAGQHL